MISDSLFCPITMRALTRASDSLLSEINTWVERENVKFQGGGLIAEPFSGLLVEPDMEMAYPITNGIPQLIPMLAISLTGLNTGKSFD